MNAIETQVRELVETELATANRKHPPFHSQHEGWAVILEEATELEVEMKTIKGNIDGMFDLVRNNVEAKWVAEKIYYAAICAACEAIQVAAMCEKFKEVSRDPSTGKKGNDT